VDPIYKNKDIHLSINIETQQAVASLDSILELGNLVLNKRFGFGDAGSRITCSNQDKIHIESSDYCGLRVQYFDRGNSSMS
jgi:hypothetical protein